MNVEETLAHVMKRLERLESQIGIRPDPIPRHPPFFGLTPVSGLHRLKDSWCQVEYMNQQCAWLIQELDAALAATRVLAPDRAKKKKGFRLQQRLHQEEPKNIEERQLEWKIFSGSKLGCPEPAAVHNFWKRLVGFQVPLYDNTLREGWDKIDLVGITGQGLPVVIELKKEKSSEKPLRPLLEAAAYAVALKKVWESFYTELAAIVSEYEPELTVQERPEVYHVLVLAPVGYWDGLRGCKGITLDRWRQFSELVNALEHHGYPVQFVQVGRGEDEPFLSSVTIPPI